MKKFEMEENDEKKKKKKNTLDKEALCERLKRVLGCLNEVQGGSKGSFGVKGSKWEKSL